MHFITQAKILILVKMKIHLENVISLYMYNKISNNIETFCYELLFVDY